MRMFEKAMLYLPRLVTRMTWRMESELAFAGSGSRHVMSHAGTVTRWHAPADHKSACIVMSAGNGPEQCPRQSRHALLRCMSPLSGVKRTSLFAAHMSAFDPKRTWPVRHWTSDQLDTKTQNPHNPRRSAP